MDLLSSSLAPAFWLSICIVGIAYVGYPIMLWATSCLRRRASSPPISECIVPEVTLLIAAHNEESCIRDRIKNALASIYSPDKLEILIASDGSTDRTNDVVRVFSHENVRLIAYETRRGKAATLNASLG
jgi:cellulose synthase/poly-beta-1,6-N-acetylglucosamine synthase-like glycosyltransferase